MSKFLTSFPAKVWFKTDNGWASREPTKADHERRRKFLFDATMRRLERNKQV